MPARQRVSPHERNGFNLFVADGLTYVVPVFIRSARVFAMASAWVVGEPGMCSVVNLLLFATEGLAYNHPLRTGPHNARASKSGQTEGMPRPRPASLEQAMDPSVPVVGVVGLHRALEVLRNG